MKIFTGKVISTKMAKTATVLVERRLSHPLYKKTIKKTQKYQVHDELGVTVGQTVRFVACKPISKLKKWKITKVVDEAREQARKAAKAQTRKEKGDTK